MLVVLMIGGFTAVAAVAGFVIFLYGRDNQVGHFRALLVQAGDRCPCGGRVVARDGDFGEFLGCTNYQDGYGCLRVWHMSGRRFYQWELHRGRAA
ncbi:MAG TPA: hypothetical protein VMC03_11960 [Streptosporangiaceae bacterium]|nr:hypothetical protein [Streptosporangiaceae bacterium]